MSFGPLSGEFSMQVWERQQSYFLPPSDEGIAGAIPLPPDTDEIWSLPLSDEAWAEQNRRANDLLMRRA